MRYFLYLVWTIVMVVFTHWILAGRTESRVVLVVLVCLCAGAWLSGLLFAKEWFPRVADAEVEQQPVMQSSATEGVQ